MLPRKSAGRRTNKSHKSPHPRAPQVRQVRRVRRAPQVRQVRRVRRVQRGQRVRRARRGRRGSPILRRHILRRARRERRARRSHLISTERRRERRSRIRRAAVILPSPSRGLILSLFTVTYRLRRGIRFPSTFFWSWSRMGRSSPEPWRSRRSKTRPIRRRCPSPSP